MCEDDPMTRMAREVGCLACGAKGDIFYWVEYYILPSRLVRKRHRDKNQAAIYCRPCYEKDPMLEVEIDGVPYSISKKPVKDFQELNCIVCDGKVITISNLYGIIASLLVMEGSGIESCPLAYLCEDCLEQHKVFFK